MYSRFRSLLITWFLLCRAVMASSADAGGRCRFGHYPEYRTWTSQLDGLPFNPRAEEMHQAFVNEVFTIRSCLSPMW